MKHIVIDYNLAPFIGQIAIATIYFSYNHAVHRFGMWYVETTLILMITVFLTEWILVAVLAIILRWDQEYQENTH